MININLPVLIPSYFCSDPSFNAFVHDLKSHGITRVIVSVDLDMSNMTYEAHRVKLRRLRRRISDLSCSRAVKFKFITNILLDNCLYHPNDFLHIAQKNFGCCLITFPLFASADICMKNIFIIKNADITPIINLFNNVIITYPKAFCEGLLTTENIYFVFDSSSTRADNVVSSIGRALTAYNTVIFSISELTSSIIDTDLNRLIDILEPRKKMFLGYSSRGIVNRFYC